MVNLLTRFKSFIDPIGSAQELNATKGVGYSDFASFFGGGYDSQNQDLTKSEYGAAQASQVLVDISASLNVWEQWLDGITWHIKDINTGNTIITTDQRVIPDGEKGARLFNAIKGFRTRYRHSYWKSLAISDWVAGETYIRRVRNRNNIPSALQWMNPLATEPMSINGQIQYYQYSNDDSVDIGYQIPERDIAYRMMRRNLFDDLRGLSPVLSVIDEANLSRNVKRAFRQYFRNGMILGGVISPDGDEAYSDRERAKIEDMLTRNHRGVNNAHSWVISPRKIFAQAFEGKNTSSDIAVLKDLGMSIKTAMGVDDVVIGNTNDVTYENLDAGINGWYRLKGIPYAKDIAEFHNNQIVPFIEADSGVYLEPELAKYEIERPEVVSQDVASTIISLYDAQRKRGHQEADEKLKDIYMVSGRPMHIDVIIELSKTKPADEIEQLANAEESIANAEAKPIESAGDSESVSNTSTGVQYDENGTAIPQEEVFGYHIESGIVDINEARAQLGLPPIEKEDANDTDLVQLNSQLQTVITAINAGMSIDEAYESVGLEPPKQNEPPTPKDDSQWGGKTFLPEKYYTHDHALNELKAWKKFRKNNPTRDFEPEYTLGDIADGIRAKIADNEDLDSVFDSAFDKVRGWQKAIQATRLDYEGDFEELLERAQASNNFGRVQWASAVRKINRDYSRKAYIDGLIDGGITDGTLSDDDEFALQEHIREQSQYVTNLGKTLFTDDGKVVTEQMALQKPAMWYNKSINPAYQLGLLSADKNGMYEWALGKAEHCSDCLRLNGQRHRMKDWTRKGLLPKSDLLECGGFNCKCTLNKVKAKARGSY